MSDISTTNLSPIAKLYNNSVMRFPIPVLLIVAAATAFLGYHAQFFRLDASSDAIVLENDPDLRYYDETRDLFGTDDYARMKNKAQGFGHHSPESTAHDAGVGEHAEHASHQHSGPSNDEKISNLSLSHQENGDYSHGNGTEADENNQDDVTLPSVENTNKHSHNDESKHDHGHH